MLNITQYGVNKTTTATFLFEFVPVINSLQIYSFFLTVEVTSQNCALFLLFYIHTKT